ncbi:uncharacterized protein BCR38DRAFT_116400 [Pseudomassariella vexata]|uniref:Uncharacterized protein n=1 Tax=Pseudomassariella vexata TaxID=1141098 RepID=A0A1Y2DBY5_9PEZI|nr:uncharacterized protein BCR38DRAFT_116400 [Pseudomassariella vexata]ORY56707.1 hypothetical protein BCR38DRAFT_116400 [Pseudomassariella vexata]
MDPVTPGWPTSLIAYHSPIARSHGAGRHNTLNANLKKYELGDSTLLTQVLVRNSGFEQHPRPTPRPGIRSPPSQQTSTCNTAKRRVGVLPIYRSPSYTTRYTTIQLINRWASFGVQFRTLRWPIWQPNQPPVNPPVWTPDGGLKLQLHLQLWGCRDIILSPAVVQCDFDPNQPGLYTIQTTALTNLQLASLSVRSFLNHAIPIPSGILCSDTMREIAYGLIAHGLINNTSS